MTHGPCSDCHVNEIAQVGHCDLTTLHRCEQWMSMRSHSIAQVGYHGNQGSLVKFKFIVQCVLLTSPEISWETLSWPVVVVKLHLNTSH